MRGADANRTRELLAGGMARVVVGTHALISESVSFADLALAIVDEQHRFGVEQRAALEAKAGGAVPHVLLMTATPIPRTLGQVLYADLDVTDLRTAAGGPRRRQDRDQAPVRARRHLAAGPGGSVTGRPHLRRGPAHRPGRLGR